MRLPSPALVAAAAATLACTEPPGRQYQIDDLRILAIRSEAPPGSRHADALPSDGAVRLRALVVNPKGRTPVRYTWTACVPADGNVPACLDPDYLRDPERLAHAEGALQLAAGEDLDVVDFSLPDTSAALARMADLAAQNPAFACQPYVEVPIVLVVQAEGIRQVAVKSVRVAGTDDPAEYVRNVNTAVEWLRLEPLSSPGCTDGLLLRQACDADGECPGVPCVADPSNDRGRCAVQEAAVPATGRFDLCAWPEWAGIQRYDVCDADGTRRDGHEVPSWQWYVSGTAHIEDTNAVGNATGERVTLTRDDDRPFTIWIVVHDGRGGDGWMRYDVP